MDDMHWMTFLPTGTVQPTLRPLKRMNFIQTICFHSVRILNGNWHGPMLSMDTGQKFSHEKMLLIIIIIIISQPIFGAPCHDGDVCHL